MAAGRGPRGRKRDLLRGERRLNSAASGNFHLFLHVAGRTPDDQEALPTGSLPLPRQTMAALMQRLARGATAGSRQQAAARPAVWAVPRAGQITRRGVACEVRGPARPPRSAAGPD